MFKDSFQIVENDVTLQSFHESFYEQDLGSVYDETKIGSFFNKIEVPKKLIINQQAKSNVRPNGVLHLKSK